MCFHFSKLQFRKVKKNVNLPASNRITFGRIKLNGIVGSVTVCWVMLSFKVNVFTLKKVILNKLVINVENFKLFILVM